MSHLLNSIFTHLAYIRSITNLIRTLLLELSGPEQVLGEHESRQGCKRREDHKQSWQLSAFFSSSATLTSVKLVDHRHQASQLPTRQPDTTATIPSTTTTTNQMYMSQCHLSISVSLYWLSPCQRLAELVDLFLGRSMGHSQQLQPIHSGL